jgi:uncharacterized membrane protein (UPF0127 family)
MNPGTFTLVNGRTGSVVAAEVEIAVTRNTRRKGLLGRTSLAPLSALVLAPCAAVHTMFMRFAIDVIFVDRAGRAVRLVSNLPPWRAVMNACAHAVIELPAGTLAGGQVAVGDSLYLASAVEPRVAIHASALRTVLS